MGRTFRVSIVFCVIIGWVGMPGTAVAIPAETLNSQLARSNDGAFFANGLYAFPVSESAQAGTDLNGDGDTDDSVVLVFDPESGTITNLGLAGVVVVPVGDRVAFSAFEDGADLNGDGDGDDAVLHLYDGASSLLVNTGLATDYPWNRRVVAVGSQVAFLVKEADQDSSDFNGDGDAQDSVLHIFDPATSTLVNAGLASHWQEVLTPTDGGVAILVSEWAQGGQDLNADGDVDDDVVHLFDLATGSALSSGLASGGTNIVGVGPRVAFQADEFAHGQTDLNGDGDHHDRVLHILDPVAGSVFNAGLAGWGTEAIGDWVAFAVYEGSQGGTDLNGDGDGADAVVHVIHSPSSTVTNTGVAGNWLVAVDGHVCFMTSESEQANTDLNGDGDIEDNVLQCFEVATGVGTNSGLAATGFGDVAGTPVGPRVAVSVSEARQGAVDLNGDGDADDGVVHVFDPNTGTVANLQLAVGDSWSGLLALAVGDQLAFVVSEVSHGNTDLNGDNGATDQVIHLFDPIGDTITNLSYALAASPWTMGGVAGTARFAFAVSEADDGNIDLNGDGDKDDQVVHVTVFDTPPVAVDDGPYVVDEGDTLTVNGVLGNDTDAEGDSLKAVKVTDPAHGTLSLASDGSFTYTHDGSETTTDSFTYEASDGKLRSGPARVQLTVTPVNDPPVAADDGPYVVDEGDTLTVNGVLGNDTDAEGDSLKAVKVTDPAHGTLSLASDGSFTYTHDGSDTTTDSFTYVANDGKDDSNTATVAITITPVQVLPDTLEPTSVGLVDPSQGKWYLRDYHSEAVTSFFYGNPGDVPFLGDWDCDGIETPGLFRTSDAYAYLRNSNTVGIADVRFFFGNPSDVPLAGDFDGDGCDTLSIYRPSEQRFYIMNELGENEGGLGAAEFFFTFGNPGDKPVVGDWDGDGIDEVGLHRESTGFFYYRNTLDVGIASGQFYLGDPGDRFAAGDWGTIDGVETPAVFRPSNTTFYFRWTNTPGAADSEFVWGESGWLPVSGVID